MHNQVRIKLQQKKEKKRKKLVRWMKNQSVLYLHFISENRTIFSQRQVDLEVFQYMVEFIGCNHIGFEECYNFHNRMKKKYRTIQAIIKGIQKEYMLQQEDMESGKQKIQQYKGNIRQEHSKQMKMVLKVQKNHQSQDQQIDSSQINKIIQQCLNELLKQILEFRSSIKISKIEI